jgi:Uma2 family endonuclease
MFARVRIMVSILEKPMARERFHRMTVATYHVLGEMGAMPERTELLRGIVFDKMSKSPKHVRFTEWLADAFRALGLSGLLVREEKPLTCADSEPEPDVAIVRGARADFEGKHPTTAALAIEIALSSEELDREKIAIYAEAGVEEHWLVLPDQQRVEVYRGPSNGQYTICNLFGPHDVLRSSAVPQFEVKLSELFGT